jgi:Transposase DDE domain
MDVRLQRRYRQLVLEHMHTADPLAAGIHALRLPGLADGFAAVLGACRFFHNDAVDLPTLIQPLHQLARQWDQKPSTGWGLAIHDWSALKYPGHTSKTDRAKISQYQKHGYELATVLLVDGQDGTPVAPLEMRLRTRHTVHSSRTPVPKKSAARLDEVLASMQAIRDLGLQRKLVHVIDREADSVAHYRAWHADGQTFLVRADDYRVVRWQDQEWSLEAVHQQLLARRQFQRSRQVAYRGQTAVQWVAETTVVLDRPAWRGRKKKNGKRVQKRVYGEAITLRLIISQVVDATGQTVAVWYLLTNAPPEVSAATLALWYYWRWQIESFFKLLKSAGQQVESWQQETGGAIAKRLLVAAMACALVWQIERHASPEAATVRGLLVKLSGRQMKGNKSHTTPALLAGLQVLVRMVETLAAHSVDELRRWAKYVPFGFAKDTT